MLVGAIVLVIAVLALRHPKTHVAAVSASASAGASSSQSSSKPSSSATKSKSKSRSTGKSSHASSPPHTSSTAAAGDVKSVPLIVLNNTETSGLAGRAAKRFEDGGWNVSTTGNLTNNIVSTCAYYDPDSPGSKAAAQALAQQFPSIQRVKKRFAQLPSGPIVVVLTSDYTSG
ncbi:LytR C-terminal domain-containing protein [uncultured Jatrophihabitans sp.]|uniref:LytR C-terminal domain-containing protein n=1 Tax=uncultured Jatrophihabitans sp. TaxID=1610747 RepID=UPI0035CBF605